MDCLRGHHHYDTGVVRGDINCDACDDRSYGDNFVCGECNFTVHRKCTFLFGELDKHLSHVGHCFEFLTTGAPDHTNPKCHICGKNTKRLLYHCSTCNLNLDIDCMVNDMSARALKQPWHRHPVVVLGSGHQMQCEVCGDSDGYGYFCPTCKLMVHQRCISVCFDSQKITHPFHVRHSLTFLTDGAPDYTDSKCHVCGQVIENYLYHCDICKFNLDMACAIEDHQQHSITPVVLSDLKVYENTLSLFPRLISFVCDACGTNGDRSPYVSFQGDNMLFHQKCVHLPRVIHVNRHDHRVSYKYPLGRGEWTCKICLEDIDWSCGAFTCSICPNYALHSTCATRDDVWDGEELDGVPEEVLDLEPFKLNEDNTITHFAHEQHKMSLNKDGIPLVESILCEGCVRPIASNAFYKCLVCNFVLHETCANLPKMKRHFLSVRPLSLRLISDNSGGKCIACGQFCCNGFMYTNEDDDRIDLVCCSITVPFIHEAHEHPLVYLKEEHRSQYSCQNCGIKSSKFGTQVLGCSKCNYYLDFKCATLPLTISVHKYDDHPLTLCYGEEEASGKYWCGICERKINPKQWFYTCNDCCVTLHIFCLLGNMFRYAKRGAIFSETMELIYHNTSRPTCKHCHCRSMAPFYLIYKGNNFCSAYCVTYFSAKSSFLPQFMSCPPWINEL